MDINNKEKETEQHDDQKDKEIVVNNNNIIINDDDDNKESPEKEISDTTQTPNTAINNNRSFDTMSVGTTSNSIYTVGGNNGDDPTANYAEQLIARNKRYHEILALLREKVDELRACRKKL